MLLAIDTATSAVGVALHDGTEVRAECIWAGSGKHTVELGPEVALLFRRLGLSASHLTGVAVAQGPGSYTGLRIGMAFAKGLSLVHGLPLVGIPTLDIVALSQPARPEPLLAVIPAGRNRVVGMWYKWDHSAWTPQADAVNLTWKELVGRLEGSTYVCGEIDREAREMLRGEKLVQLAPAPQCVRRPGFLAELAWLKLRSRERPHAASLRPIYL